MVLLALTSNHRFVAIAVPIRESGRSCETARGRDTPVEDGSVRQRIYPAKTGQPLLRNQRPEAAIRALRYARSPRHEDVYGDLTSQTSFRIFAALLQA